MEEERDTASSRLSLKNLVMTMPPNMKALVTGASGRVLRKKEAEGSLTFPDPCQIGVVVKDLDKSMEMYSSLFGVGPWKVVDLPSMDATFHGKPVKYKVRAALAKLGCIVIELVEVLEGETTHTEFFRERGEGIHHIAFLVDDLDKAVAEWEAAGIKVLQRSEIPVQKEGDTASYAYMDTEDLVGILLEFIKVPRERVKFYKCPHEKD